MKPQIELTKNKLNNSYHIGNTLFNNKYILKLAKLGYYHLAMKMLVVFLRSSLLNDVRGDVLCKEFSDTHFGTLSCSGWSYIYHPEVVTKQNAIKIAKANLLYMTNPIKFFKVYTKRNVQDSLCWLKDYYGDYDSDGKNKINHSKLLSRLLEQAHICYDDDYGVGQYVYVINKGNKQIVHDNANDGTGDTGAWIIGNTPKIRKINQNDIDNLIKILRVNHIPKYSFEKGTKKVYFENLIQKIENDKKKAYL